MTDLTPAEQAAADALRRALPESRALILDSDFPDAARAVVAAVRSHLATEPPVHDGIHHYLSTGCLHGDTVLLDGRTGHQYCQGMTGMAGAKRGARCKFCDAKCQCSCHKTNGREDLPMTDPTAVNLRRFRTRVNEVDWLRADRDEARAQLAATAAERNEYARAAADKGDRLALVRDFINARRGIVQVLRQYSTDDMTDYHRWTGHAEARRVLAEDLGLTLDPETGGLASHEPATATGAPGPDPSEGTAPTSPQEPTQAAVDTIARILVGTDWDEEVPYTDIGPRDTVAHLARRIIAATHEAEGAPERVDTTTAPGGAAPGPAPLTLAQAAGHLHDWARDLTDGTNTSYPHGHPSVIRGIRAAADWLDARAAYETEVRQRATEPEETPTLADAIAAAAIGGRRAANALAEAMATPSGHEPEEAHEEPPCIPVTVHTYGLTDTARNGLIDRVATAAHALDEDVSCTVGGTCPQCDPPEEAPEPTWRDVIRAMRAEGIHLRPLYDIADWPVDRTWQLIDHHGSELGIVTHETSYAGEEWTLALSYERGPSTRIGAEALQPADVLAAARIAGLIGDTDA